MIKRALLLLMAAATLNMRSQTVGAFVTRQGTPSAPAVTSTITANAGVIVCTVSGDSFPAKVIMWGCQVDGVTQFSYPVSLTTSGLVYVDTLNFGADYIKIQIGLGANGQYSVQGQADNTVLNAMAF